MSNGKVGKVRRTGVDPYATVYKLDAQHKVLMADGMSEADAIKALTYARITVAPDSPALAELKASTEALWLDWYDDAFIARINASREAKGRPPLDEVAVKRGRSAICTAAIDYADKCLQPAYQDDLVLAKCGLERIYKPTTKAASKEETFETEEV